MDYDFEKPNYKKIPIEHVPTKEELEDMERRRENSRRIKETLKPITDEELDAIEIRIDENDTKEYEEIHEEKPKVIAAQVTGNKVKPDEGVISLNDLLQQQFKPPEWFVENMIETGTFNIVHSHPGEGKSTVMLAMSLKSSANLNFGPYKTKKMRILFLDLENSLRRLQKRADSLAKGSNIKFNGTEIYFYTCKTFKINNDEHMLWLKNLLKKKNIDVVIIDPLVAAWDGDENSAKETRSIRDKLIKSADGREVTWFLLHHSRKDNKTFRDEVRGSTDLKGMCDNMYCITKKKGVRTIEAQKLRDGYGYTPLTFEIIEQNGGISLDIGQSSGANAPKTHILKKDTAKAEIIEMCKLHADFTTPFKFSATNMKELLDGKCSRNSVNDGLRELLEEKKLTQGVDLKYTYSPIP